MTELIKYERTSRCEFIRHETCNCIDMYVNNEVEYELVTQIKTI